MDSIPPEGLYPPGGGVPRYALIDVRAPVEVARGALPGARNLPILEDHERHLVGLRYREAGQRAAVALGFELTAAAMPARVAAWRQVAEEAPAAIACWRGGLRSELAQRFLARADVPRVAGGYKALRGHLMTQLAPALARHRVWVLGGLTGSGKTELLRALAADPEVDGVLALDLEAAAGHRGSAFGAPAAGAAQPPQQTFEHRLALPLLLSTAGTLLLEDESRAIGARHLPEPLYAALREAPRLRLEAPLAARVARIHREYVLEPALALGPEAARARLEADVNRLRRRLGNTAVDALVGRLRDAFAADAWREAEALRGFIRPLLTDYYDPLYRKAAARSGRPVLARGDEEALRAWIRKHPSA